VCENLEHRRPREPNAINTRKTLGYILNRAVVPKPLTQRSVPRDSSTPTPFGGHTFGEETPLEGGGDTAFSLSLSLSVLLCHYCWGVGSVCCKLLLVSDHNGGRLVSVSNTSTGRRIAGVGAYCPFLGNPSIRRGMTTISFKAFGVNRDPQGDDGQKLTAQQPPKYPTILLAFYCCNPPIIIIVISHKFPKAKRRERQSENK